MANYEDTNIAETENTEVTPVTSNVNFEDLYKNEKKRTKKVGIFCFAGGSLMTFLLFKKALPAFAEAREAKKKAREEKKAKIAAEKADKK